MGLPSYCQGRQYADQPLPLEAHIVSVPKCPDGHHGVHRVQVNTAGEGIPLVVAHGYTGDSRVYRIMLGLLARRFKVIAIDLAGHGGTADLMLHGVKISNYADLVACTLRHLGVKRALFVGHSLGGRVVTEVVAKHPDLAIGLVMVNAIIGEDWDLCVRRALNPLHAITLAGHLVASMMELTRGLATAHGTELARLSADTYLRYITQPWRLLPAGIAILAAPSSAPVCDQIHAYHIPTIVVWGETDPLVTRHDAETAAERTGGRLIVVPRAGHNLPLCYRDTLPDMMDSELDGALGRVLDQEVIAHGFDPATATAAQLEQACIPNSFVLMPAA